MIIDTLLHTIQRHHLVPPDSTLILAISGGTDSLALLHAFVQIRVKLRCEIIVATLNHGLRAAAADDVRFVQDIAQQWQVPCVAGHVDVPQLAKTHHLNLEAAARQARYHFLAQVAQQAHAAYIVTAHHADDQAETILMHILRGAGSTGLQGMAYHLPLPQAPDITLIRPMLDISRVALEAYCQQHGLQPRHDETNTDTTLLRNAIRLEIMPRLAQINPQIHTTLARLGENVRVDQSFLQQQFDAQVLPHQTSTSAAVHLPLAILRALHPALQRRWLITAVRQLQGNTDELSYERIQAALQTAQHGTVGAIVQLPHQLEVALSYTEIAVRKAHTYAFPANYWQLTAPEPLPVLLPGITQTPNHWQLHTLLAPPTPPYSTLWLPPQATLTLRTRRPGDVFAPAGLNGQHQKLKKWFIDHKIPQALRDSIPLLIVNDIIAAILLPQWILSATFIYPKTNWQEINFVIIIKDK